MEVVSVATAKKIDSCAINDYKIPSIALMETASHEVFNYVKNMSEVFHIFCGIGNNGADGLVIARKLIAIDKSVFVYVIGDKNKRSDEFISNYDALVNLTKNIFEINDKRNDLDKIFSLVNSSDTIIDCIFGSGLNRDVSGIAYTVISRINQSNCNVIAVDIPSGLNGDSGKPMGISVFASMTCTIENYKKGFFKKDAHKYLGILNVMHIGIPSKIKKLHNDGIYVLRKNEYKKLLPIRDAYGHKGNYGRVLILAGSREYTGAAFLSSMAAINTGSGLVTLLVPDEIQKVFQANLIEVMTVSYSSSRVNELIQNSDVIACGPGLSLEAENVSMLRRFINESECSVVLDADALNALSEHEELIAKLKNRCVVTPHLGEFSRMTRFNIKEIEENTIEYCMKYAKDNHLIVVLKGHNTIISDGKTAIVNRTGDSKMASGGMGDTLTGIIASLIGQKIDLFSSAILGAYIHGISGEEASKNKYSIKASDLIECIPKKMAEIINL